MDAFEARLAATPRVEGLEEEARQLGLYLQQWDVAPHPEDPEGHIELGQDFLIVVALDVGQVAFSDRVQHPEQFVVDSELKVMELDTRTDDWLDTRQEILDRIAAGQDPLGEPTE